MIQLKTGQSYAIGKYIRISPIKARQIVNQIRGYSYREALLILEFMPHRACRPVWAILQSAAANANKNLNLSKEELIIKEAFVDKGPILRRFRPRAQGRAYKIQKPTSHITIVLALP